MATRRLRVCRTAGVVPALEGSFLVLLHGMGKEVERKGC